MQLSFTENANGQVYVLRSVIWWLRGSRLFRTYQTDIDPFMPLLVNGHEFEVELCAYVQKGGHATSTSPSGQQLSTDDLRHGMPMDWISTLFALLACGVQFGNEDVKKRQEQSCLYGKCGCEHYCRLCLHISMLTKISLVSAAFEALRLADFLMRPSNLGVQSMLLLGFVLQNEMRPQAAWLLLGTTVRMAQSLGLHKAQNGESSQRLLW